MMNRYFSKIFMILPNKNSSQNHTHVSFKKCSRLQSLPAGGGSPGPTGCHNGNGINGTGPLIVRVETGIFTGAYTMNEQDEMVMSGNVSKWNASSSALSADLLLSQKP